MAKLAINPLLDVQQKYTTRMIINPYRFKSSALPMIWTVDTSLGDGLNQMQIPTREGYLYSVNYIADEGTANEKTGSYSSWNDPNTLIAFNGSVGSHTIKMIGVHQALYFNNGGDKLKMISVDQFGYPEFIACDGALYGCSNLTGLASDNLDVFINCPTGIGTFRGLTSFNSIFPQYNFENMQQITSMFYNNNWTIPLPLLNFPKVTTATLAFANNNWSSFPSIQFPELKFALGTWANNPNLLAFPDPGFTKIENLDQAFINNEVMETLVNVGNWNISNLTTADGMLLNVTLTTENYTALLIGWAAQAPNIQNNVTFHGGDSRYDSTAIASRAILTDTYGWTITDGGGEGYAAVYDAFTTKPSAAVMAQQLLFYDTLNNEGIWNKLDWLAVFAGHTNGDGESLLNWINPNTNDATLVNPPSFTAFEGFTGNAIDAYIDANWAPEDGDNYTLNSSSFGVYARLNVTGTKRIAGSVGGGSGDIELALNQGNTFYHRNNDVTYDSAVNADSRGLFISTRESSSVKKAYKNKSLISNVTTASTGLATSSVFALTSSASFGFTDNQISLLFTGASLNQLEVDILTDAFEVYMDSNGKGVI